MHSYSTDSPRWKTLVAIGVASVLLTALVNEILGLYLPSEWVVSGLALTMLTVAGLLYTSYRYFFWLPVGRYLKSQVPNLNGRWRLTEDSTGDMFHQKVLGTDNPPTLHIDQDWSKIQIDYFDRDKIYLRSDSAKVATLGANNPEILFTYSGEVPDDNSGDFKLNEGTFRLRYLNDGERKRLVGIHYDSRPKSGSSMVEFELETTNLIEWRPDTKIRVE